MPRASWLPVLAIGLKVALVALLAFGAFSGLQQFEGKAFGGRLIAYPLAVLVVPAAWAVTRSRWSFPALADLLLTLPFFIDVAGNALDLYDSVDWWDDANHFVNWGLLSGGAGVLMLRGRPGRWTICALVLGFGGVSAILWELAEYIAFIRDSPEFATAYADTLGDLALGLTGSAVAGVVCATLAHRRPLP